MVGIGCGVDGNGFEFLQLQEKNFSKLSGVALGPPEALLQRVLTGCFPGSKAAGA
jgi:hypothetical protein